MRALRVTPGAALRCAAATCAALTLVSCNSTIGNGGGGTVTRASPVGVWVGIDSVTSLSITAYINSAGQATFFRSDGVQFDGSVQISGSTLAATVTGYTDFSSNFNDGSNTGIGTLNGTVTTGDSLRATLTFTTDGGTMITGTWQLNFEAQSNTASSTAAVSGNYTDNVTGTVLSINNSGVMTSQNANNGCVLNGSISTSDSTHDLYEVAFSYGNCTGTYAVLNGVQFTGLATLNASASPLQLSWAVSGASATAKYGLITTYNGS